MNDQMTPAEAARVAAAAVEMLPPAQPSPAVTEQAAGTPAEPVAPPAAEDRFQTVLDGIHSRIEEVMARLREVEKKVTDKIGTEEDVEMDPTEPNDAPKHMDPVEPPDRGNTPV